MKGYIIATEVSECYGHGDYGKELAMKQENAYHTKGTFPPIFLKKDSAAEYLSSLQWKLDKTIEEVEIVDL
jgi:hypothetical protein